MDSGKMFGWIGTILLVFVEVMATVILIPWPRFAWLGLTLLLIEVGSLPLVSWLIELIPYWLARKNMFWTMISEGASKQVTYKDKFSRSLLSKTGYKLDEDWTVIPLDLGEKERTSGLYWVGIWPFYQIYKRTMKFTKALSKALSNGKSYEERADPETDFLITGTDYQYALVFEDAEDSEKLPLSGHMTMTARINNPYKALFLVKEWFDALVNRVLPRVREYISEHSYDELINSPDVQLDTEVFSMLNQASPNGGPSICSILESQYGIKLVALETVNIDPPKEYREATLRQFSAVQTAKAEAEETGGALDRMIDKRIDRLALRLGLVDHQGGIDYAKVREHLQGNPQILEQIEKDQLDLLRRDRAKGGLRDIRVANADGSNLGPVTATLMSLIDLWKNQGDQQSSVSSGRGQNPGGAGKSSNKEKENKKRDILDELEEEDVEEGEENR